MNIFVMTQIIDIYAYLVVKTKRLNDDISPCTWHKYLTVSINMTIYR
ncbi:hypothetical protein ABIS04_09535 [Shewanella sp. H8]